MSQANFPHVVNATYPVWTQNPEYIEACRVIPHAGDPTAYDQVHHPLGASNTDNTSFKVGLAGWNRFNLPNIMYQLWPCQAWKAHKNSPKPGPRLDAQGNHVFERYPRAGKAPRPIPDYPILRGVDQISTEAPWWWLELILRLEPRLEWKDIDVLMENVGKRLLQPHMGSFINARQNTLSRGRQDWYMVSWREKSKGGSANMARDEVLSALSQQQINANTTRGNTPGPDLQGNIVPLPVGRRSRNPPPQPAAPIQLHAPTHAPAPSHHASHTPHPTSAQGPIQTPAPTQYTLASQAARCPKMPTAGYKRARPLADEDDDAEGDDDNDLAALTSSGPGLKRRRTAMQHSAVLRDDQSEQTSVSAHPPRPTGRMLGRHFDPESHGFQYQGHREIRNTNRRRPANGVGPAIYDPRRPNAVSNGDLDVPPVQGEHSRRPATMNGMGHGGSETAVNRQKRRRLIEEDGEKDLERPIMRRRLNIEIPHDQQSRQTVTQSAHENRVGRNVERRLPQSYGLDGRVLQQGSRQFIQEAHKNRSQRLPPRSTSQALYMAEPKPQGPYSQRSNISVGNQVSGNTLYGYPNSSSVYYGNPGIGDMAYGYQDQGAPFQENPIYSGPMNNGQSHECSWWFDPYTNPCVPYQPQLGLNAEFGMFDNGSYSSLQAVANEFEGQNLNSWVQATPSQTNQFETAGMMQPMSSHLPLPHENLSVWNKEVDPVYGNSSLGNGPPTPIQSQSLPGNPKITLSSVEIGSTRNEHEVAKPQQSQSSTQVSAESCAPPEPASSSSSQHHSHTVEQLQEDELDSLFEDDTASVPRARTDRSLSAAAIDQNPTPPPHMADERVRNSDAMPSSLSPLPSPIQNDRAIDSTAVNHDLIQTNLEDDAEISLTADGYDDIVHSVAEVQDYASHSTVNGMDGGMPAGVDEGTLSPPLASIQGDLVTTAQGAYMSPPGEDWLALGTDPREWDPNWDQFIDFNSPDPFAKADNNIGN